jgi:hypothetical protein
VTPKSAAPARRGRAPSQMISTTGPYATEGPVGSEVASTAADLRIGDRVTTRPTVRPERFARKTCVVVHLNIRDDEVGVSLGYGQDGHRRVVWFQPHEVVVVDTATTGLQGLLPPPNGHLSTYAAERPQ